MEEVWPMGDQLWPMDPSEMLWFGISLTCSCFFFLIIYSFFTVLGLCCCLGFSLVGTSRGYSLVAVLRLLITVASPVMEYGLSGIRASVVVACGLYSIGSIVVVYGLSCFSACGIFWDQGSKLCLLHWQAYFLPLSHQGSPACGFDAWSWRKNNED